MPHPAPKSYALRIDGALVKPLQALKKQNRRSLNAEINAALEAWIAASRGSDPPSDSASLKPADDTPSSAEVSPPTAAKEPKRKSRRARVEEAHSPDQGAESAATAPETKD
jgi:hypothetical protein